MQIDTSDIVITTDDLAPLSAAILAACEVVNGAHATDQELAERLRDSLRAAVDADRVVHTLVMAAVWCEHWGSPNEGNAFDGLRWAVQRLTEHR